MCESLKCKNSTKTRKPAENKEGWAFPANLRKAHYFLEDKRSLCGQWAYFGDLEQGNDNSPDNCAICKRKLAKRKTKEVSE